MSAQNYGDGIFESPQYEGNPCNALGNPFILDKKPVPYTYTREGDVVWKKTVWRELHLKEKQNQQLYYPLEYLPCRISLFQIMSKYILSGKIIPFEDENFNKPLSSEQINKMLRSPTEVVSIVYDEKANEIPDTLQGFDSTSIFANVLKVRLREDWFYNKQSSSKEVRTVAMGFYEYVENKEAFKELFWVYFPSTRKYLAKYRAYNPKNENDISSFDDIFRRREFASVITKESNVYDREIGEYCKGLDAVLESDRVKYDIFKWEHDLWNY
jgi:gliding motility associated protien GldN